MTKDLNILIISKLLKHFTSFKERCKKMFKDFIYLFLEGERGREDRERNINV